MTAMREKVIELSKQEPRLTRAEIAIKAGCGAPYVTIILGAEKKYKPRTTVAKEELAEQA